MPFNLPKFGPYVAKESYSQGSAMLAAFCCEAAQGAPWEAAHRDVPYATDHQGLLAPAYCGNPA